MTKMLTDDDLRVIDALDFEPGCVRCENTAEFHVAVHSIKCGCPQEGLVCGRCKDEIHNWLGEISCWTCSECGAMLGFGAGREFTVIDRIEPLR